MLSAGNIIASPTTSWLGVAVLAQGVLNTVATHGLPNGAAGWAALAASALGGFVGLFGRL